MDLRDRFRGCLVGLAAGDAVGTTVEFRARGTFAPLTDLVGGGPFNLRAGDWTDDTAMALCLAASLVACRGFDARDQMLRYRRWWREGYWSPTGQCFDIGRTVAAALGRFEATDDPFAGSADPRSAGNGSLMRLCPVALFAYPDLAQAETLAAESSRTTHAADECLDACRLFARMLVRALSGAPKDDILCGDAAAFTGTPAIVAIARGGYRDKREAAIRSSGYVVHTLEAALWCFLHSADFAGAVLAAANLGDDADTTAAVCGQLAGAHYGVAGIPAPWRARLALHDDIVALADGLRRLSGAAG